MSGSLLEHVFIKKALMKEFPTDVSVENIYSSDQDALRIMTDTNSIDFHTSI